MIDLWPGPVRVYFEGSAPPAIKGAELRPLDEIDGREHFLKFDVPKKPHFNGFLWDAKRFCHKVFAQLDAMKENEAFWWVDADVLLSGPIPWRMVEQFEELTFLGRDSYTETGLIGFNPNHPGFDQFKNRYSRMYMEGDIFGLQCWTDCHAFDAARQGRGENLTPQGKGFENVMEQSRFGPYMTHFKGPRKAEVRRLGGAREISAHL
jgi:hypothetical protein